MQNATVLNFKYTTSKGRNTYGYNIVTLYANGQRVARTCGGGYDMRGTCLGQYLQNNYLEYIKRLPANYGSNDTNKGFYGLKHYVAGTNERSHKANNNTNTYLDGACGINEMVKIAEAIGLNLQSVEIEPNNWGYILTTPLTFK